MERLVIGMLAHVDAGKTTLSEALLFKTGAVRRLGRVDHGDAFLDTHELEKERGITIFSKQAQLTLPGKSVTLLDTPGHVDFSAEAERVLSVLDYAVLVISAAEGATPHTRTLWQLLMKHRVPVFVFVNKLDLPCPSKKALLEGLKKALGGSFADFGEESAALNENIAACSERLMEEYFAKGALSDAAVREAVRLRQITPVYFGSALKLSGVDALIDGLARFTEMRKYPDRFGARVFKISRMDGARLTLMKITGGALYAKQVLTNRSACTPEDEVWEEKADGIRVYSGARFTPVKLAEAGSVVAVTGLTATKPGEGLGVDPGENGLYTRPVLEYSMLLPEDVNAFDAYRRIAELAEEEPELNIEWDEAHSEIRARLMGEVQCEVLSRIIKERFGLTVTFGPGSVIYRETVANKAAGIGHFEPLRHFAHVELTVEPGARGSGIELETDVGENELARSWQRLILGCLADKKHRGVLTGAPLTDVKITLTGGRAHLKHTEGGDFRKASSRAVRNALMFAQSVLLEPYYEFTLTLPADQIGRAMNDIRRMEGEFSAPETDGALAVIRGFAPVSEMRDYYKSVAAYTRGRGSLRLVPGEYRPCHNAAEVIRAAAYDPEADLRNTPDSVFCAAGAGFTVKWFEVASYIKQHSASPNAKMPTKKPVSPKDEEEELRAIFERTYGAVAGTSLLPRKKETARAEKSGHAAAKPEFLLVDGYNVIFAWDALKSVAMESIDSAREALIRMMINFNGVRKTCLILVFDAYKVTGGTEKVEEVGGIHIVYTRESEIADVFIERAVQKLTDMERNVRVVTSDAMEQLIIMGRGALRVPASAFQKEVELANDSLKETMRRLETEGRSVLHLWQKMDQS